MKFYKIQLKQFNTNVTANTSGMVDWREADGYFFYIMPGRTIDKFRTKQGGYKLARTRLRDLNTGLYS